MGQRISKCIQSSVLSLYVNLEGETPSLRLIHQPTGLIWADGPVVHRVQTCQDGQVVTTNQLNGTILEEEKERLSIIGQAQHMVIRHEFCLEGGILSERIELYNKTTDILSVERFEIGLTWPLTDSGGHLFDLAQKAIWVPIPGRRHQLDITNSYEQFCAEDLIGRRPDFWFGRNSQNPDGKAMVFNTAEGWPADGWCFTVKGYTLVILKHAIEHCEFSVLDAEVQGGRWFVRLGGTTLIHDASMPMPGKIVSLLPGQIIKLGLSRYEVVQGDWQSGYTAFRRYFDTQGYIPSKNFNPPVHWNQLYDMPSWNTVRGYSDRRQELYTLEALWGEARKAREYQCEALYLDPGWDTGFGSSIWDEVRLGLQKEFSAKLKKDYSLGLSLHCPLAGWCDAKFYPSESLRQDEQGRRLPGQVCSGAKQYLEVKAERLSRLCENGAIFLMYDGAGYTGPCFDSSHGHPIPYMIEDHALSYRWLCDVVQEKYPDVLIELHDVYLGGLLPKHFPLRSGLEIWGNEYMWATYENLFTGQMKCLDYLNRAYSIPIYLHIALQTDNEHGLAFWYAASTCRHLGVGGTHPNPQVAMTHKGHMARYHQLKRFFTQGQYYAIDENTHLHVLPDIQEAVLVLFNFTDQDILRSGELPWPEGVELSGDLGGGVSMERRVISIYTVVPSRGVKIILLEQHSRIGLPKDGERE